MIQDAEPSIGFRAWGYHYFQINPLWRCSFEGINNIDPDKTYVLVSNHQSYADIILLYGLYRPFKWVSKKEILALPFIGWNMMLNQYVILKRGDMKSIREMMQTARNWLNMGASVMVFPEGTRSQDAQLQPFRDGAFRLAIDCNVEVVPIVIDGTFKLLSKRASSMCFNGDIRVKILAPVGTRQFEGSSGKMRDYVHDLMLQTLSDMRGKPQIAMSAGST